MTALARKIMWLHDSGLDAEQILAEGVGESTAEVDFIIEQIKIARSK